jgi:hypothetical protein
MEMHGQDNIIRLQEKVIKNWDATAVSRLMTTKDL